MCDSARPKFTTVTGTVGSEGACARRTLAARRADARFFVARFSDGFDLDVMHAPRSSEIGRVRERHAARHCPLDHGA
jgi:hypothetical protein